MERLRKIIIAMTIINILVVSVTMYLHFFCGLHIILGIAVLSNLYSLKLLFHSFASRCELFEGYKGTIYYLRVNAGSLAIFLYLVVMIAYEEITHYIE